jgi:hypothetical protein
MKFNEFGIAPAKPKTPEQQKIEALKRQKYVASNALKAERKRQKLQTAQKQIQKLTTTSLEK